MHRRTFLTAPLALAACDAIGARSLTRVIVFRHADRAFQGADFLGSGGQNRANNLVTALEDLPIDAIYLPELQRNIETAEPLAAARGLPLTFVASSVGVGPRLMLQERGKSVIWIGNKANITSMWEDLDLPDPAPVNYGELAIIEQSGSRTDVTYRFVTQ